MPVIILPFFLCIWLNTVSGKEESLCESRGEMLQKIRLQMRQKDDEIKVRRVTTSEVTGKIEKIIVSKKKKRKI